MKRAADMFKRRLRDKLRVRDAFDRLMPDVDGHGIRQADVIIEAIFEHLPTKQALFAKLEAEAKPGAILATNTSSLKLADIAANMKDPSRLVGIHFFNPVPQMQLVEVVTAPITNEDWAKKGAAFVRQIDKLPLHVKDAPGFLVNRVLGPYMPNALSHARRGHRQGDHRHGHGAVRHADGSDQLADTVGLDIVAAAGKALAGDRAKPPKQLEALIEAQKARQEVRRGLLQVGEGQAGEGRSRPGDRRTGQPPDRPYLVEAKKAVDEGIVADADLADAGLIFGTGFAPFRGGPMNYLAATRIPVAAIEVAV